MGKKGKWEEAAEKKVAFPVFGIRKKINKCFCDGGDPSHVICSLFCMCLMEEKR